MTDIQTNKPMSETSNRLIEITGIALILTIAFHFLLAERYFGFGYAAFIIILASCMVLIAALGKRAINMWAFIFLLPAILTAVSQTLYSNEVSRTLSFFMGFGSLTLFAFWLTRPLIAYKNVKCLWPFDLWLDTIWPYRSLGKFFNSIKMDKKANSIILGIVIAIPFLLIFLALFTSADQLFAKSFSELFNDVEIGENVFRFLRDIIVALFFLASGILMYSRMNKTVTEKDSQALLNMNNVAVITFLISLNILFAIFVIFQAAYFFGGEALITAQDITYAEYARHGFFELLFASGLVFGIVWFIYRTTEMKNRIIAILNVVMIALTGIIIISAISRLLLYIDTYGLTRARWWAAACIVIIGLTLFTAAIGTLVKISYRNMAKTIFLMSLMFAAILLVVKSDGFIAQYNVNRYLQGKTKSIDVSYLLNNLSSDAVPALVNLANNAPDEIHASQITRYERDAGYNYMRSELIADLEEKNQMLKQKISDNWLSASVSDLQAMSALDTIN